MFWILVAAIDVLALAIVVICGTSPGAFKMLIEVTANVL